jgi:hypothetical protein
MGYVYDFTPEVMGKLINLTKTIMNFRKNHKRIADLLIECNLHCASYDNRHKLFGHITNVDAGFGDHIDFLLEIVSIVKSVDLKGYRFEMLKEEFYRIEELKQTISSFIDIAHHVGNWLGRCNFINDLNCEVSQNKQEIITFFQSKLAEFDLYRTALDSFGTYSS